MKHFGRERFVYDMDDGIPMHDLYSEIEKHYENEVANVCNAARNEGLKAGENRRDLILSLGIWTGRAAIAICLLLGIWYLCAWWIQDDQATLQGYMQACQSGDAVGCLEGVQDQERQHRTAGGSATGDRAMRYRIAYRIKTGRELPER
jgi:hypothetical protein